MTVLTLFNNPPNQISFYLNFFNCDASIGSDKAMHTHYIHIYVNEHDEPDSSLLFKTGSPLAQCLLEAMLL
jgi:hypothetical protein